jgi:hypothetical protein
MSRQNVTDWAEQQLALLRPNYEGRWDLWFVRCFPNQVVWCAKPCGVRCATINASTPEDLVAEIAEQEAER